MTQAHDVLAIGADNAGADLKNLIKHALEQEHEHELEIVDYGVADSKDDTAYPHIGLRVAQAVAKGDARRGVLICGTGIGMAISANKVPGIRATVAHDSYSVERSVLSNNCQVLTMGARVIGPELAVRLVKEWLTYEFDETTPSAGKVAMISDFESNTKSNGTEDDTGC